MKNLYLTIVIFLFSFVFVNANTQTTLWSENFEGDWTANWHADAGTWEAGIPTSGPNSAYAGVKCAATVLGGNYSESVSSRLIRHSSFIVPSASENPRFRFWSWFSFSSVSDWGEVQIKVGDGAWESISNRYNYLGGDAWSHASIDLSDYAGSAVQLAFYFQSVNDNGGGVDVSSGWYIDDVSLVTGSYVFNNPENFESGIGDWSVDEGTWEVGIPTNGPSNSHGGQNCAGTNLDGSYQDASTSRLISPPFIVPTVSENPRFRFWSWFSFSSISDWGVVQIKVGDGEWESISNRYNYLGGDAWSHASIDLSDYAGSTVQLAFYFQSVNDNGGGVDVSSGWYIDDVSLVTGSYVFNNPENFESGIGDWSVDEGTWEVGTPTNGPSNSHGGQNCAGTNLDGSYQDASTSRLISPPFIVPSASENPALQFWHWYSFSSVSDWGEVQIKVGDGAWETLSTKFSNTSSGTWTSFYISLSAYANSNIQLAFYFQSVNDNGGGADVSSGWYIDDLRLLGTKSVETDILTFAFATPPQTGDATINATAKTIDIEVEYGTDVTALVSTFTLSDGASAKIGAVTQISGTTANNFSSPLTYTVTAEDGTTTQDWMVTVTEAVGLNDKTDFLAYNFATPPQTGNATINTTAKTIDIEVEYGTDVTALVSTFTLSDGATAKIGAVTQVSGTTANNFSSPLTYTITAEDGTTTQDWMVTVTLAPFINNQTEIESFAFGTPPQTGDATINATAKTIDIEVEYGTDVTALVSTFTLSDGATAKIGAVTQVSGTTANDFSSPLTYTITAEDGTTTQDWVVTVTLAPFVNDETDMLTHSFGTPPQTGNATINATAKTIDIEVEYGTDVTALVSTFTLSNGATAKIGAVTQVSGTTANNFSSPLTYTITAEDGTTTQDWMVTVTLAPFINNQTEIESFAFGTPPQTGDATINATAKTIDIEVEYGTDVTALVSTFTLSNGATAKIGAVAQLSGTTANNFSSPLTYTITAEDGTTTQDWVVTVTEAVGLNDETDFLAYNFATPPQTGDVTINATAKTIDIEVEYGSDVTALVATFTLSNGATATIGAVTQVSGTTANNFSSPLTYTITAEDGITTQDWVVTITLAPFINNQTEIESFAFATPPQTGHATINATAKTIDIEVKYGTDVTALVSTFTLSDGASATIGAIAQESGVSANNFTNPVTYTITAEDGITTQDWVVTVTHAVVLNDETDILTYSLGTPPQTGDATINATAKTIDIEVEYGTDVTALVSTFTLSDGATAKVGAVTQLSGTTANNFSSPVTYTVTAEDGTTTQDWVVTLSVLTSISENLKQTLNIYPNPFSDKTTIEFSNFSNAEYKISVYSITGNKVFEIDNIVSNKVILQRGSLKSGIYLIEIRGEQSIITKKVIVR